MEESLRCWYRGGQWFVISRQRQSQSDYSSRAFDPGKRRSPYDAACTSPEKLALFEFHSIRLLTNYFPPPCSQWNIYRKWVSTTNNLPTRAAERFDPQIVSNSPVFVVQNERLFTELYVAYQAGRAKEDPSVNWAKGEIGFFDFYIIPLAKKLKDCGVFGVSSDEYLNYALANRREWESRLQKDGCEVGGFGRYEDVNPQGKAIRFEGREMWSEFSS